MIGWLLYLSLLSTLVFRRQMLTSWSWIISWPNHKLCVFLLQWQHITVHALTCTSLPPQRTHTCTHAQSLEVSVTQFKERYFVFWKTWKKCKTQQLLEADIMTIDMTGLVHSIKKIPRQKWKKWQQLLALPFCFNLVLCHSHTYNHDEGITENKPLTIETS